MLIYDHPYHTNTGDGLRTFPHTPPHLYAPHVNPIFYPYGLRWNSGMGWYGGGLGQAGAAPVAVEQDLSNLQVEVDQMGVSGHARADIMRMIQYIRSHWGSFYNADGTRKPMGDVNNHIWVTLSLQGNTDAARNWLVTNKFHYNPEYYQTMTRTPPSSRPVAPSPSGQQAPAVADWGAPPAWGAQQQTTAQQQAAGGTAGKAGSTGWGWWPWLLGAGGLGLLWWYSR